MEVSDEYINDFYLGGIYAIYELLPAFICGLITIIVVSLVTSKPSKEIEDTFEEVKAMK